MSCSILNVEGAATYNVDVEVNYSGKYVGIAACGPNDGEVSIKDPNGSYISIPIQWSSISCTLANYDCQKFTVNGTWTAEIWVSQTRKAYKTFTISTSSWPSGCMSTGTYYKCENNVCNTKTGVGTSDCNNPGGTCGDSGVYYKCENNVCNTKTGVGTSDCNNPGGTCGSGGGEGFLRIDNVTPSLLSATQGTTITVTINTTNTSAADLFYMWGFVNGVQKFESCYSGCNSNSPLGTNQTWTKSFTFTKGATDDVVKIQTWHMGPSGGSNWIFDAEKSVTITTSGGVQYHNVCQNNVCAQVTGAGTNECSPVGSSCGGSGVYYRCENNVCNTKTGVGTSDCNNPGGTCGDGGNGGEPCPIGQQKDPSGNCICIDNDKMALFGTCYNKNHVYMAAGAIVLIMMMKK